MVPAKFSGQSRSVLVPVVAATVCGIAIGTWVPVARIAGVIVQVCWFYIVTGARG
jgi:hypothetical protein